MARTRDHSREGVIRAIAPIPSRAGPERFAAYSPERVERTFHLWSTVVGRNATLTASLLAREAEEGETTPAASSVRRWTAQESWAARADADLTNTHSRTVAELRAGWLGALTLGQQTLLAGLVGDLDELPHAGAARLKSAELVLKTLERAGAVIVPRKDTITDQAAEKLTVQERARRMRESIAAENATEWG